jgi:preprotein translocase subunit SecY
MNTKISEKMVTGLFTIWLAVVIFLTVQINTYKIENEKLKEYIKKNQYSEENE